MTMTQSSDLLSGRMRNKTLAQLGDYLVFSHTAHLFDCHLGLIGSYRNSVEVNYSYSFSIIVYSP